MTTPVSLPQTLTVQRGDDETISIGPIRNADGTLYNATGHTSTLVVKSDRSVVDGAGTAYPGVITGDVTSGFFSTHSIPSAALATAATVWHHAKFLTPSVKTFSYGNMLIDAV